MLPAYDTVGNDDCDSDTDNENIVTEVLKLRNYQLELADPALQGKNCIIVAPTGSGKTYIALKIIQDHMEKVKSRFPKVVFLVGNSALAQQHADQCKKFLSQYRVKLITGEIHRDAKLAKPLSSWLNRRDILVVTAQILVNAMRDNDIKIEDFTLMVFDECHHAHANHAYTQIIDKYMDFKFDENIHQQKLPMIVGFTASVGVGRTSTEQGAEEHIQRMMANLDAEELVTVKRCLPELSEYVIVPEQEIVQTKGRNKNYFGDTIVKIMECIEKYMMESAYASLLPDNGGILKGPADKGSDPYVQWISRLWRETAKINNQDARRYFETCRLYLELYNKVLIIYEDAHVKDSMEYLEKKLRLINEGLIKDETDTKMMKIYQKGRPVLCSCIGRKDHVNPKLEELKEIIFRLYRDKPESRVIVLIKTRDLVQAIENWMKETDGLSCLNPVKFVGTQASEEKGVQREKLDEWLEKQKSIGSFVLPIPIVPLVNISYMPYLESEQQDATRNVAECDSEKAAVTDAQETTANEQTKPRTKRLRLNSKITVQMKLNDVEGTYHCPLCNKPSVQDVVGCDNCMEWYHLRCLCLTKEPKSKTWFCGYCDS